jgi:penicillin-binding protein 2
MNRSIDFRMRILAAVFLVWAGIIVATLWYMQVVKGEEYMESAVRNRIRLVRIPAPRGLIRDRNGVVLADNRPSFDLLANPTEIDQRGRLLEELSRILHLPAEQLDSRLDLFRERPFEPVRLAADIGIAAATVLKEKGSELAGVEVQVNPVRHYPFGPAAVHLLGYVGQISPAELVRMKDLGYRAQDDIGKIGVEEAYDSYLRGQSGLEQVQVNARLLRDRVLSRKDPVAGNDLVLTVDIRAQLILDELLAGWKGAGVLLDPGTGDILALVSHPSFDPNLLTRPVRRSDAEAVFNRPDAPLLNRALAGEYPPGSPFKLVLALAGLESGVINRGTVYHCPGIFVLGRSQFRCWRPEGHGLLNLQEAIKHSCNVYFYHLGLELGVDRIEEMARRLGMGERSGIEIRGESPGLVPGRAWKREQFGRSWYPGDTVNLSIGQGYLLVTPIQMAGMGAAIAGRGTLCRPRLVSAILSPTGEVIKEEDPVLRREVELSPGTWEEVLAGMKRVVNEERGTGRLAAHPSIPIAGKTGTIQVGSPPEYGTHAWFLALAPAGRPELVLALLLEDAESGGHSAAPVVGEFFRRYLAVGEGKGIF